MADKDNAMDYPEHEKTYSLFLAMTKYGSIAIILVLIFMAVTLL